MSAIYASKSVYFEVWVITEKMAETVAWLSSTNIRENRFIFKESKTTNASK